MTKRAEKCSEPITSGPLFDAIRRLNWIYGRGCVFGCWIDNGDTQNGAGRAWRQLPVTQRIGHPEIIRFRIVRGTVHVLGHQRKLGTAATAIEALRELITVAKDFLPEGSDYGDKPYCGECGTVKENAAQNTMRRSRLLLC